MTSQTRHLGKTFLILAILLILGMAMRFWLHRQPTNSDDIQYFHLALNNINFQLPTEAEPSLYINHTGLRLSLLLTLRLIILTLGYTALAFYSAIYSFALLNALSLFLFSWALSGKRVGLIVLAMWTTSNIFIEVDTRLVPDNLGTSLSLLAIAAIAWVGRLGAATTSELESEKTSTIRFSTTLAIAFLAGFLLWMAWSVRATFGVFCLAAGIAALLSRKRLSITPMLMLGFLVGMLGEVAFFNAFLNEPMVRFKILLGYGDSTSASTLFQGYTWSQLFSRYPKMLYGSPEIIFHWMGLVAGCFWLFQFKRTPSLVKLITLLLAYGTIALGIVSLDPLTPLLREKSRYYATAQPIFYLGAAELFLAGWNWLRYEIILGTLSNPQNAMPRKTFLHRAGALALLGVFGFLVFRNGHDAAGRNDLVRNGNDSYLRVAEVIEDHAERTGRNRKLVQDWRTYRVMHLLLSESDGWQPLIGPEQEWQAGAARLGAADDPDSRQEGYRILNWKRLNANVRYGYVHAPLTHEHYLDIETHPLLLRHRYKADLTDVLLINKQPIVRSKTDASYLMPEGWRRFVKEVNASERLEGDGLFVQGSGNSTYTGKGKPWDRPLPSPLAGQRLVEVLFKARAESVAAVRVYLYWWADEQSPCIKQYLGRVYADDEQREMALWTYLPADAAAFRIVFRGQGEPRIDIREVRLQLLGLHEDDVIAQIGDAW